MLWSFGKTRKLSTGGRDPRFETADDPIIQSLPIVTLLPFSIAFACPGSWSGLLSGHFLRGDRLPRRGVEMDHCMRIVARHQLEQKLVEIEAA